MPYRAISSYFSPGAAATRRPPAGRPARPAAGTLPPPARGLGPRRIRPAWGGGPGPGPAKPPPRGCAGRTRPQASWRAREGGGCPPESPRVPASPAASGSPGRGLLRAVEPRAWPSPTGSGAGGPGERAGPGSGRWVGCAGPERRLGARLLGSSRVSSAGGAARPGGARERLSLAGEEAGGSAGRPPRLPSRRGGVGWLPRWTGGRRIWRAAHLLASCDEAPRRQFEEEGAKSFCTQK